ncbi:MAG: RDD family protein [Trueperaceae bacterium]|nr:RDD family protein [Trueperaceae bacterium]
MDAPTPTPPATPSPSPSPAIGGKPDTVARFLAYLIDAVAVYAVGMVPVIGGLVGIAYVLARDGLEYDFMDRRSIGKKIMKLRPVRLDGQPMDLRTSFMRNWPLTIGSLAQVLWYVPIVGWVLLPFVAIAGLAVAILEVVRVLTDPEGRRWGDLLAGTKVVVVEN